MEAAQPPDPRRARRRLRYLGLGWTLVCLFFVGFGASLVWKGGRTLPATYASLRSRGVAATAHLVRCAPGIGGGRGVGCRVSLTYRGRTRTWNYPEDAAQFERLQPGAPIAVLVDTRHPATVYTVHDVNRGTNAGLRSPVLWYGVILIAAGVAGLAGLLWLVRPRMPRLGRESG